MDQMETNQKRWDFLDSRILFIGELSNQRIVYREFWLVKLLLQICLARILTKSDSSLRYESELIMQVLGVSKKTSSDNIQRAYRSKLHEARVAGDEELISIIEQAHSSIMMQQLSKRMEV